MPWKDGYTTSDEKTLADRDITWPESHQCAFVLVIDLSGDEPNTAAIRSSIGPGGAALQVVF